MTDLIRVGSFKGDHAHADDMYDGGKKINDFASSVLSRLSQTLNAGDVRFAGGATNEAQIQLAVNQAVVELAPRVFIPASKLPFDISLLDLTAFNASGARLVWEGGDWTVYDVRAYGADPTGTLDAGPSWNAARGAIPAIGGELLVTNGAYKLTTAFSFGGHQNISLRIDAGVSLSGVNATLPGVVTADNNLIIDYRSGFSVTRRVLIPVNVTGRGPGVFDCSQDVSFLGTIDPVVCAGYNWQAGGPVVAGEPGIAWVVEGNYNDGTGNNKMEGYLSIRVETDSTERRPIFFQYDRTTHKISSHLMTSDLFRWQSETGGFLSTEIDPVNQVMKMYGSTTVDTVLRLQSGAGRTAYVEIGPSASKVLLKWDTATQGSLKMAGAPEIRFYSRDSGTCVAFAVGVNENDTVGKFVNVGTNNGVKGVVARGRNGQTAALFQAEDFNSNSLWSVTAVGNMNVGANQVVGTRKTGWTTWTGTAARGTQNADGPPTLTQVSQAFKALLDDLISHGLVGT